MRAWLEAPFLWRREHLVMSAAVIGFLLALVVAFVGFVAIRVNEANHSLADAQRRDLEANARLDRIEARQSRKPTQAELAAAAASALNACIAAPSCRNALRGAIRKTNLQPSDIPALRPPPSTQGGTSPGGSGTTGSGGGGSSGPPASRRQPRTPVSPPQAPSQGRRPQPAPTPPAAPPNGSGGTGGGNTGTSTTPPPSTTAPPVTTPPVTPTVPPVTVPPVKPPIVPPVKPPIRVCTPVVTVNCKDDDGRFVGVNNTVDPDSNSGRGNQGDDICERLRQPPPPFPGVCPAQK